MSSSTPVIYLLNGEDEFAIAQCLSEMEAKLGDSTAVSMNVTRLDGRTFNIDELPSIAGASPFLAKRRMVILTYPTARVNSEGARKKFLAQLKKIPPTTALVLVEFSYLTGSKERQQGKLHWLEQWALGNKELAEIKEFPLPKGKQMEQWIHKQAGKYGSRFTPGAAATLVSLVGENPRLADQEIHKLLAYTNYQRRVEKEDVERLVPDAGLADIFILVDAVGNGDRHAAMEMLQRLLDRQEPGGIFGMVVRQFRLLLQAREILDQGAGKKEVAVLLKVHPFVAEKITAQARHFSLTRLEAIYHRLLEADETVKSGEIPAELSLEMLVVE